MESRLAPESETTSDAIPAPFVLVPPRIAGVPLVVASPHSGHAYPQDFLALSRLDRTVLRRSEDFCVDELLAGAPGVGAHMIHATFPRIYCDVNRDSDELDPTMFTESLPPDRTRLTPRVRAGLGVIPRISASGTPIYRTRLPLREAAERLARLWTPYHAALSALIDSQVAAHGACVLVDCHSMPSTGLRAYDMPDFVLGDAWGTSCAPAITEAAETCLRSYGFRTNRNAPYAGGYITRHYGRPATGRHALQVEISRALYMDENGLTPNTGFGDIRTVMTALFRTLAGIATDLPRMPGAGAA
ncbi:N-formylglutamate amidohydrolase [Gluconacetobacter takamatsuzukensis]|uniref:N-formylglutamate amidohydrolase n=1 Tax=Gluconacetobacter takamatsuzukensis TaxID=1286190 RepID=A0A7W4KG51_9PROT|nr:N-formylglutamate amidohydrolase [Gluconacetobacter takamatsuzukensis]MBB2206308.1 N-formylglutamate amidohydrolase [Gluconacetobacter takamatsuzukensis]